MPNLDNLVSINKSLVKPASFTAAHAFIDDPETIYLIPNPKRRISIRYGFEYYMRLNILAGGESYVTSPQFEGVALWSYSVKKISFSKTLAANPLLTLRCGWRYISYQLEANRIATEIKKKYAPAKHMYLSLLAVDPPQQGKGFASALLKPMLKKIDESHLAVYVETQNTKNVAMYEHFGFNLVNHITLFDGCCHLYAMVRDAR